MAKKNVPISVSSVMRTFEYALECAITIGTVAAIIAGWLVTSPRR